MTRRERTRIEKDTMGEVRVPARALYGAQTARAVENFPISGLRAHPAFVDATVRVKLAAARVNARLGLLPRRKARAIEAAAREVLAGEWRDQFVVDVYQAGAGTSHNMNVNEVLANRATELLGGRRGAERLVDPNDDVNMAQSTNDVVPTAIRLAALELAPEAIEALAALARTFEGKARRWDRIVKSGRTHLMDATPIRLGQEVSGWAVALSTAAGRIRDALPELSLLGIGGTAVGTGLNAHPRYRALVVAELERLTGVPLTPAPNLFYAMQSLAPFVALSAALRTAALELLRIGGDVRLLGSGPNTGLGELRLPPVQPGSSIMPGKVNPSMAEMLAMACTQVVALDGAIAGAAGGGQLELNVMMPLVAFDLCHALRDPRIGRRRFRPALRTRPRGGRGAHPVLRGANREPRDRPRPAARLCARRRDREGVGRDGALDRGPRGRAGRPLARGSDAAPRSREADAPRSCLSARRL